MAASAHAPSFPETSAESLTLQACDEIDSLHELQNAYAGLEKLIATQHLNDAEEISPTRTELSALVRVVNEELRRRIGAADRTLQSLRVEVTASGEQ
jgi:5-bromo-4-chloroindolyl phosphate hydrolysis protein